MYWHAHKSVARVYWHSHKSVARVYWHAHKSVARVYWHAHKKNTTTILLHNIGDQVGICKMTKYPSCNHKQVHIYHQEGQKPGGISPVEKVEAGDSLT